MYAVRNLSSGYGKNIILHDLSIDIPPGITSLIGPNGAGKSTFLRVLAGLSAYTGNVSLHGCEVR
ncbi:MAG: ATP-binding cassette domain-containing protein, partial [Synergistaceae bacterium]|nr:ATP-binding cassette domain-containing protein [Synergistaceae bacterium]